MMQSLALLAGAGLAHGLAMPRNSGCQTTFSVSGSISGDVGEISSGQARVGKGIGAETYTYDASAGTLVDSKGSGCFWTPPTYTLQCDQGKNPPSGFKIGCDGQVSYDGQTTFYQCMAGSAGMYNLYLGPNGYQCAEVTIHASSCYSPCETTSMEHMSTSAAQQTTVQVTKTITVTSTCPESTMMTSAMPPKEHTSQQSSAPPAMTSSAAPPPSHSSGCPDNLSGNYQFPHLIIPISSSSPSTAAGSSYFGEVSSTVSSLFNFDIPQSYAGKTCKLEFLLPLQSQLETSSFTLSGSGAVEVWSLKSPAVEGETSYDHCPAKSGSLGQVTVVPGNKYVLESFACPAGKRIGFEMGSVGGTALRYFQDYNPCPIGMYITAD